MKKLLLILMLVSVASAAVRDKATDSLVLSECTEDTALTSTAGRWYASSGQPLEYDANGFNGNRGIVVTSINNITSQGRLLMSSTKDISAYDLIRVSYKIEDTCRDNSSTAGTYDFRLFLMTNTSNLNQYYVNTRSKLYTRDNWYTITFKINRPNDVTGAINYSSISSVSIVAQNAVAKGALRLTIGNITVLKSTTPTKGYFTISLDGAESTMLSLGLPVFQRYNCKPMLYHIPSRVGVGWELTYMSWAQVDSLYRLGWEIGHMGYSHANFDTCSAEQIRTEIQRGHDTLAARGYVHKDFFAVPYGHKTRKADTVATEYTFVRRGVNGLLDVPPISSDQVCAPMFTGKYVTNGGIIQNDTSATGRWNTVKIAIDSAVARKSVSGIIIHKFRTSASVEHGAVMDTATLDTMLHYLDSLKIAGVIDYGSISRLFTPPPAVIAVQPVPDTVIAGQAATFFVTSYSDSVTYQWYRNDSLIAGATNDTFTYTARSQVGNYTDNIYCLLTTDTTISTDTVNLLVNGIVFRQSVDTLKLVCSNNQNVGSWQWYKNNVAISGATDSVLSVVVDSTSATKSVYYCEISNGAENKKVGDWTIERKANGRVVSRKNKYK